MAGRFTDQGIANGKGEMMYWVICEPMDCDCGHRWIAYPATPETLQEVIEIAKLGDGKVWVTKEDDEKK